jgi:tRNA threonylcarbamoyl adenosine modification protein YeaZ
MTTPMRSAGRILAIDTALQRAAVALGDPQGRLIDADRWIAGHRHSAELLPHVRGLLERNETPLTDLIAIVVGTGPGAFTGLRVGIATAKALAHGLGCPIVGIRTSDALTIGDPGATIEAPGYRVPALLLPAGPSDRVLVVDGVATLLPAGAEPDESLLDSLVAVDLAGRASPAAVARGEEAMAGLCGALLRLGARRLAQGDPDDLARLVPDYVTLPRGVVRERGEVAWSHGPR